MAVLLCYSIFFRGGLPSSGCQQPIAILTLFTFLLTLRALGESLRNRAESPLLMHPLRWRLGVSAAAAAVFCAWLLIQYLNAGRPLIFDSDALVWTYAPARWQHLPASIKTPDAVQALYQFLPAIVLLMSTPFVLVDRKTVLRHLEFISAMGLVLGLIGIVQFSCGTNLIYGVYRTVHRFFASFSYVNQAANLFLMLHCLALGQLHRTAGRWISGGTRRPIGRLIYRLSVLLVTITSVHLTMSHAVILLTWVATFAAAIIFLRSAWRNSTAPQRVSIATSAIVAGVAMTTVILTFGGKPLTQELLCITDSAHVNKKIMTRVDQLTISGRAIADRPFIGHGASGFRYVAALFMPSDEWHKLKTGGSAYVHNDPVEWLVEYGALGTSLIVLIFAPLAWPPFRRPQKAKQSRRAPAGMLILFIRTGIVLSFLHSLMDIPYRSPGVLALWATLIGSAFCIQGIDTRSGTTPRLQR